MHQLPNTISMSSPTLNVDVIVHPLTGQTWINQYISNPQQQCAPNTLQPVFAQQQCSNGFAMNMTQPSMPSVSMCQMPTPYIQNVQPMFNPFGSQFMNIMPQMMQTQVMQPQIMHPQIMQQIHPNRITVQNVSYQQANIQESVKKSEDGSEEEYNDEEDEGSMSSSTCDTKKTPKVSKVMKKRRRLNDIKAKYACPISSCKKHYASENSVFRHIKIKHSNVEVDKYRSEDLLAK